jgi:S-DNA-T family DNA segregation ATPase FtsK/SpoIIIE
VPVGVDEDGGGVAIGLVEHNLLLGGEPGAGKSGVMSMLVAAAALDPSASLWLMDGKLVELAPWRPVAVGFAGVDIDEAIALLRRVKAEMDTRFAELLDLGRRKVAEGTGLHVVVCDELAHYLTWPDKKARDAFTDALRDLVSRGRAAGVIVLAATQKPGSDVVPTSIRDLFGYRLAMRCATAAASDTILGSGWAAEGYSAATIDPATRGVGFLLHESGVPAPMRAHWLDDGAIDDLATRAAQLRGINDASR